MKNSEIVNKLKEKVSNHLVMTTKEITDVLVVAFPNLSPSTISWRINQLKKEKLIHQTGRGLYSFEFKPDYVSEISLKGKRLYNRISSLCETDIAIWETKMLSNIVDKELNHEWIFISTNKENLEPLFNEMLDFSKQVFLLPDTDVINRYILPQNESIILTSLVSETPLNKNGGYLTLSIEAILVDSWLGGDTYFSPIGLDIKQLYKAAFSKYNVNQSKLLRYAARRDKRKEINEFIKTLA